MTLFFILKKLLLYFPFQSCPIYGLFVLHKELLSHLKIQNIYIKSLETLNTSNKPCFIANLNVKCKVLFQQKVAQNVPFLWVLCQKNLFSSKSSPIVEKLPNLVTLLVSEKKCWEPHALLAFFGLGFEKKKKCQELHSPF